jgi:hypothetical protein
MAHELTAEQIEEARHWMLLWNTWGSQTVGANKAMANALCDMALRALASPSDEQPVADRELFEKRAFAQRFIMSVTRNKNVPQPRISGALDLVSEGCPTKAEFIRRDEKGRYLDETLNAMWWAWQEALKRTAHPQPASPSRETALPIDLTARQEAREIIRNDYITTDDKIDAILALKSAPASQEATVLDTKSVVTSGSPAGFTQASQEAAPDALVSITVGGSTHTRTAAEWLALARRDLAAASAPPGYTLWPDVPTDAMLNAGWAHAGPDTRQSYRTLRAEALKVSSAKPGEA